jgi:hypothetical protein
MMAHKRRRLQAVGAPLAARIIFAIHVSPNSASCERVFSLPKLMFGDQQINTLADDIRVALMLRSNDRMVGWVLREIAG